MSYPCLWTGLRCRWWFLSDWTVPNLFPGSTGLLLVFFLISHITPDIFWAIPFIFGSFGSWDLPGSFCGKCLLKYLNLGIDEEHCSRILGYLFVGRLRNFRRLLYECSLWVCFPVLFLVLSWLICECWYQWFRWFYCSLLAGPMCNFFHTFWHLLSGKLLVPRWRIGFCFGCPRSLHSCTHLLLGQFIHHSTRGPFWYWRQRHLLQRRKT